MKHKRLLPVLVTVGIVLLAGCATIPRPTRSAWTGADSPAGHCADLFFDLDQRVSRAGVIDAGAFRVPGFPYLRVNRFLASFREAVDDHAAFNAWVDHLQILDQVARSHEIANLPDAGSPAERDALQRRIVSCGDLLKAVDFRDQTRRQVLRDSGAAPDDYILLRQILGMYPIPRWFISRGVDRWQRRTHNIFSVDPPADRASVVTYAPAPDGKAAESGAIIRQSERDALGIPRYRTDALAALFQQHAPCWEIDPHGDDDRIGKPYWTAEQALAVDIGRPVVYTLLSYTRFQGEVLPQLNYIVWFPARPKVGRLDIYGGLLDGVNYRVTLDSDGQALLHETVHACGCYYAAYPTPRLAVRQNIAYAEPPLILTAPDPAPGHRRLTLTLMSGTHYVHRLYSSPERLRAETVVYTLAPYDQLRAMADGRGGRRGMFDPDSLAPGTQRLERLLFWPTGVYSAGAMRQWGRHAVAFAGRRHFDEPFYMDKMFIRK